MTNTQKQTPLTVENFQKFFMERINDKFSGFDEKFEGINKQFNGLRNDLTKVVHRMDKLEKKVDETNKRVKFLPTTEVYLKSQDELMGQLKKVETETKLTGQHYQDMDARVKRVEDHVDLFNPPCLKLLNNF